MNNKNKKLSIILGLLIVSAYLYYGPYKNLQFEKSKTGNFLASISAEEIDKIEIDNRNSIVVLHKEDEKWRVDDTKSFYLSDLVKTELEMSLSEVIDSDLELVSENIEKMNDFQTNDEGVIVRLIDGEKKVEFVVGKVAGDGKQTYIAKLGDKKTYLVKNNLNRLFLHSEWYNKRMFDLANDKISKIRFQYPGLEFSVEKKDEKWVGIAPYDFNVSDDRIKTIVDKISGLKAVDVPAQTFEGTGLEKHNVIVQVIGEGIDATLMIGDANERGEYYAKTGASDNIYMISSADRDLFKTSIGELK